jgi:hypothetical protein
MPSATCALKSDGPRPIDSAQLGNGHMRPTHTWRERAGEHRQAVKYRTKLFTAAANSAHARPGQRVGCLTAAGVRQPTRRWTAGRAGAAPSCCRSVVWCLLQAPRL